MEASVVYLLYYLIGAQAQVVVGNKIVTHKPQDKSIKLVVYQA